MRCPREPVKRAIEIENYFRVIRRLFFVSVVVLVPLCLLFSTSTLALDRDRTISQLHHTAWTAKDGAPGRIEGFAQTTDGYLWLATPTGLYRFDGVSFERYVPLSGTFPSDLIYHVFASPDGGLWITYWYGKVSFLKDGNLTNYGEAEGLSAGTVRIIAKDADGMTWAAGMFGLARLEGTAWKRLGPEWNFLGKNAISLLVDKQGTIWVATEDTIVFLPRGATSFEPTGFHVGTITQMLEAPDGTIWLAETQRSVRPMPPIASHPISSGPEIKVGSLYILFDHDGTLWIPTIGDGLRRINSLVGMGGRTIAQFSTEAEIFTEKDGLTADLANTVFEDREGNIWIGTVNGLDRFREGNFGKVGFPTGYHDFGLAASSDGDVWTVSLNRPSTRVHNGAPISDVSMPGSLSSVSIDPQGAVWMGGQYGVVSFLGDRLTKFPLPQNLKVTDATSIFNDREGTLWVYFNPQGIFTLKNGVFIPYSKQEQLPKSASICGVLDETGKKWYGFASNTLVRIDGDTIRTFTPDDGLQVGAVRAINVRSQNVWAGGESGVGLLKDDQFQMLSPEGTEAFKGVTGIVQATDGSLWITERRGIINIPAADIRRFFSDPAYRVNYRIFDFLDGLPGSPQQQQPSPTAIEGSDGKIWFATSNGLAWIDPARIYTNGTPPPVSIQYISSGEQTFVPSTLPQLPKGTTSLRIAYTALSLTMPERVGFRYKLEGVDRDWQDADTRREAFYTNLGPGTYRFQVIAANNDGVWNNDGAVMEFKILPMFYQTYWFLLLCLAVLACLIWAAYRFRVHQLNTRMQMQFDERLSERTRIARNLHDTLLQGIVSAAMQLEVISDEIPDAMPAKPRLTNLNGLMRRVINEGREAVRELRSSTDAAVADDLDHRFLQTKQEFDPHGTVEFRTTVDGTPRPLVPLIAEEVHQICREALINVFRHAQATSIEVEIDYSVRYFIVTVGDNGRGIDPEIIRSGREGHWGLSGMKERAQKIGAELKVCNRPNGGAEVKLSLAARFAYRPKSSNRLYSKLKALLNRK